MVIKTTNFSVLGNIKDKRLILLNTQDKNTKIFIN